MGKNVEEKSKACNRCERLLPLSAFSRSRGVRAGYYRTCRECCAAWRRRHRGKAQESAQATAPTCEPSPPGSTEEKHKICHRCKRLLPFRAFHRSACNKADGCMSICKDCRNAGLRKYRKQHWERDREKRQKYQRQRLERNRQRFRERDQARWRAKRQRVLAFYGGNPPKCAWCGATENLQIDHIDGSGYKDRLTSKNLVGFLLRKCNPFPPGFQVLCASCNFYKGQLETTRRKRRHIWDKFLELCKTLDATP